jgi:hypothetical protein
MPAGPDAHSSFLSHLLKNINHLSKSLASKAPSISANPLKPWLELGRIDAVGRLPEHGFGEEVQRLVSMLDIDFAEF